MAEVRPPGGPTQGTQPPPPPITVPPPSGQAGDIGGRERRAAERQAASTAAKERSAAAKAKADDEARDRTGKAAKEAETAEARAAQIASEYKPVDVETRERIAAEKEKLELAGQEAERIARELARIRELSNSTEPLTTQQRIELSALVRQAASRPEVQAGPFDFLRIPLRSSNGEVNPDDLADKIARGDELNENETLVVGLLAGDINPRTMEPWSAEQRTDFERLTGIEGNYDEPVNVPGVDPESKLGQALDTFARLQILAGQFGQGPAARTAAPAAPPRRAPGEPIPMVPRPKPGEPLPPLEPIRPKPEPPTPPREPVRLPPRRNPEPPPKPTGPPAKPIIIPPDPKPDAPAKPAPPEQEPDKPSEPRPETEPETPVGPDTQPSPDREPPGEADPSTTPTPEKEPPSDPAQDPARTPTIDPDTTRPAKEGEGPEPRQRPTPPDLLPEPPSRIIPDETPKEAEFPEDLIDDEPDPPGDPNPDPPGDPNPDPPGDPNPDPLPPPTESEGSSSKSVIPPVPFVDDEPGGIVGEGEYPREVQWRQGKNYRQFDLNTGQITASRNPKPGGVRAGITPQETLKVIKKSKTRPKIQKFSMGRFIATVGPSNISFSRAAMRMSAPPIGSAAGGNSKPVTGFEESKKKTGFSDGRKSPGFKP